VTIFVVDASPGPPSRIARFKQLWKLSNKEAQFADLLLRGLTVKEATQMLDMTFVRNERITVPAGTCAGAP
jgi:hypothetical protein